jgi:hypothetical protein
MIFASFLLFILVVRVILPEPEFSQKRNLILALSFIVVVLGMLFGKFGANWGLPWWVYYTTPMLITVFLPPLALKLNTKRTIWYLILSFLSAPFIHICFSFFFGWQEYIPFWEVPYWKSVFSEK